jgi:molybdenum cofactor guanylyltransferase
LFLNYTRIPAGLLPSILPPAARTTLRHAGCYDASMQRAGFILTGGRSSRMGSDKALFPWNGITVVEYISRVVASVAGSCTVVGHPERYSHLGLPCLRDVRPGRGPLSGIETALAETSAEWNLILSCDIPEVTAEQLELLFDHAIAGGAAVTLIRDAGGALQPLCAVYHRRSLAAVRAALDRNELRLLDVVHHLQPAFFDIAQRFQNINTPEDWRAALLR